MKRAAGALTTFILVAVFLLFSAGCGWLGAGETEPPGESDSPSVEQPLDDDEADASESGADPAEDEAEDDTDPESPEAGAEEDDEADAGSEPLESEDEPEQDPGNDPEDEEEAGLDAGPDPDPTYGLEQLPGSYDRPLQVLHAGDGSGRLFVVQQPGRVFVVRDGEVLPEPFLDLRDRVGTRGYEQGLLSIAFHPGFGENGRVYVSYTGLDGASVLARFTIDESDPDRLDPDSEAVVLTVDQPYANHNGGLALFGPDGYLYFGLGDGGSGGDPLGNGQNPQTLLGSLLRIDVDVDDSYATPADNPFVHREDWRDEIWAFGLRNPWRFSFDPESGDLYIADVGQDRYEEVNVQPAGSAGGENYGWNRFEGSHRYSEGEPVTDPVFPVTDYDQSMGDCSVTGGEVYRGEALPTLSGTYLFGDLCSGRIYALNKEDGSWRMETLIETEFQITSFGRDASGEILVVDHRGGVYRLVADAN